MPYVSGNLRWGIGGLLEPDGRKTFHAKLCDLSGSGAGHDTTAGRGRSELKQN